MKQIIINDNNLSKQDVDYEVIRVKGLVINSKKEILLIENNHTFQFPGGHFRKGESLESCLSREIAEELGVDLKINKGPFMMITTYDNDYFKSGSKVINKIYYFVVKTDITPDISRLNLDATEKETDFNIWKIKLNDLDSFLNKCLNDGTIDANIGREMLLVINEYNNLFGGIL